MAFEHLLAERTQGMGASATELDLRELKVTELTLSTGASST